MTECIKWIKGLVDHQNMSELEESLIQKAHRLQSGDSVYQNSSEADYLVDHLSDEVLYYQFLGRMHGKLMKDRINPSK